MNRISIASLSPFILILSMAGCGFKANTSKTTASDMNSGSHLSNSDVSPESQDPTDTSNSSSSESTDPDPSNSTGSSPEEGETPRTNQPPVVQDPDPITPRDIPKYNYIEPSKSTSLSFWDQFEDPSLSAAARVPCQASPDELGEATLKLINFLRTQGLSCNSKTFGSSPKTPLRWDDILYKAAKEHAKDMTSNNFFSHRGSDGSSHGTRARRAGWPGGTTAESIAGGQKQTGSAVVALVVSDAHCEMLLAPNLNRMGIACQEDRNYRLNRAWVLVFGRR